jgi:beta-glucanase (GH16 family)
MFLLHRKNLLSSIGFKMKNGLRRTAAFALFSAAAVSPAVSQVSAITSKWEYQLMTTYSDEFNGGVLSANKWADFDSHSGRSFDYDASYIAANCNKVEIGSEGTGVLKLIAKNETVDATNGWDNVIRRFLYQGGTLYSKAYYKYGYFEIRAKKPAVRNTNGMAFWFWHREDGSQIYSEIDVFETQPAFNYRYPMALHYSTDPSSSYIYNQQGCDIVSNDLTQGWHTYGIEWAPDYITWYIDGVMVNNKTVLDHHNLPNTTVSTSVLGKMCLVLNNIANFGMEASTQGDVMEVDYLRYYKRKPNISLVKYDATTGFYTYSGTTGNPEDTYTWSYNTTLISDVTTYTDQGLPYIKFKRVSPTGSVSLTLRASQVLTLENAPTSTATVTSQNAILVGTNNSYFSTRTPYFSGGAMVIQAFEATPNSTIDWQIGLKNSNGSIDWSAPQTQYNSTATFTGLLSGKTYVIKHRVYSVDGVWLEATKEIAVQYDTRFFIDFIQPPSTTANTLNMQVHQASTNPDSEWHIELVNSDGSIDYSVDQPKWGNTATFTGLLPGKKYKVRHGNYGLNQAWVESSTIVTVDFESNFEFYYAPTNPTCIGSEPQIKMILGQAYLPVYSKPYELSPIFKYYNHASCFFLYELDANGNYQENATPTFGPVFGNDVLLPVQLGKNYMVKHGVYPPNGYWTETRKTVRISPRFVKSASLGSVDSLGTGETATAGIDEENGSANALRIFPNPTEGVLIVEGLPAENITVTLFDATGRTVLKKPSFTNGALDLSTFAPGTYYIKIESPQGTSRVMPIIKQ